MFTLQSPLLLPLAKLSQRQKLQMAKATKKHLAMMTPIGKLSTHSDVFSVQNQDISFSSHNPASPTTSSSPSTSNSILLDSIPNGKLTE